MLAVTLPVLFALTFVWLVPVKADWRCSAAGGTCGDVSCCPGQDHRAGLCSGDASRKCCFSTLNCADHRCHSRGGACGETSCCTGGNYVSGLCSGANSRKCCLSSLDCGNAPTATCTVGLWTGSNFIGDAVYVENEFRDAMEIMNNAAGACGVKVHVTHSWRKVGATISNTVVSPASNSNHLVGMAIDMNLNTPSSWCDSGCLNGKSNTHAMCFINAIKRDGLTWGGDWSRSDPVHIDDRRNQKPGYSALRDLLQQACSHIPMS